MKISIFGVWYVWLVAGVCYADLWHDVLCCDIDIDKINKLKKGQSTIYEKYESTLLCIEKVKKTI